MTTQISRMSTSSTGPQPSSTISIIRLSFPRVLAQVRNTSARCAAMPQPGPWTWGIAAILATSGAVKQRREACARLVAVTSTMTTAMDPPDPPDWAASPAPMIPWITWTTSPPTTPMEIFEGFSQDEGSEGIDFEFFESNPVAESLDPGRTRVVDLVSPLHGLFFESEEMITEEQLFWTIVGIILSAALDQFGKIAISLLKLVLVQEVETETPTMQEHEGTASVQPKAEEWPEPVEMMFHDCASREASPSPEVNRQTTLPMERHLVDVWCSACQQKMTRNAQTSGNWQRYSCSSYPHCRSPLLRPFGQPYPSRPSSEADESISMSAGADCMPADSPQAQCARCREISSVWTSPFPRPVSGQSREVNGSMMTAGVDVGSPGPPEMSRGLMPS